MRRKIVKMNSKAKSKLIILLTLGIVFGLSLLFTTNLNSNVGISDNFSNYRDEIDLDNENLKISAVSGLIHINNNWTAAKSAGICTGNGTYTEPYVIEDLEISGVYSRNCILIQNSDVFFRIENCTLYYSSGGSGYSGIKLSNVNNSQLIDNDCSFNGEGIYLVGCNNNTISGNTANNNANGIHLSNSNNNTISRNNASDNDLNRGGIMLSNSNDNIITGNTVNRDGIFLSGSNNTVSGNRMNHCGLQIFGFSNEDLGSHNIDTANLVNGKPLYYYTNEINLGSGDFTNAGQVILVSCSDSTISNLNISYTNKGISLHYCNNNEISNNIVNNNFQNGIRLEASDNNLVSNNIANNCSGDSAYAIELSSSNYNTISGNNASNNVDIFGSGIRLSSSDNNIVSGNTANENHNCGIYLFYSDDNEITGNTVNGNWNGMYIRKSNVIIVSGNTVNDNENGIAIRESILNDISENIVNSNARGIFVAISSDFNTISENDAKGNEYGIYVGVCFYNEILGNNASNNDYGIYLAGVFNSTISENIANNNLYGIYLEVSLNNTISENSAANNVYGIYLDENSAGNKVYLNCFNNTFNAIDEGSFNHWDNGIKGNYWDDYTGLDENSNGIGDVPYTISGSAGSQDNFPLIECPSPPSQVGGGIPIELVILISSIGGAAVIGVATLLLIKRKRKRID